ncbi:MAG TPA: hypothetical protein PK447_02200 [Ignavibacteria bacterium]|nr:hypothetical protein [Ignavibacteria bacterium]
MKKFFLLTAILLFTSALFAQGQNVSFVFDNSGSTYGFYNDAASTYKVFAKALMKNAVSESDFVSVYLFSKTEKHRGITSPQNLFQNSAKEFIPDKVLSLFKVAKGTDNGYANTDIIEALDKAIADLKSSTGVIWLVTDNINDNSGMGADSSLANTLEFYKRLRNDDNVRKILLYPVPDKLKGENYSTNGYVCYAIVYSLSPLTQAALESYDKYIRGAGINVKPITLKPLDVGTVVLSPKVTQSKVYPGKLYFDGKTLRGFGFSEGEKVQQVFSDLALKSNLYPYIIRSASLDVRLENFSSSDYSVKSLGTQKINPSTVSNVSPEGEVKGFSVTFNMPEITPSFSFNTIFKEDFTVGGQLVLEVSNVDITLDTTYLKSFQDLFALNSVPDIFKPVLKDKKITTTIPLEIKIKYGSWRMFVLIGMIVLLVLIILAVLYLLLKKNYYHLKIDSDEEYTISLSAISSYTLSKGYSGALGKIKKGIFGTPVFTYSRLTSSPGSKIRIAEGIPVDVEYSDGKTSFVLTSTKKSSSSGEEISSGAGDLY